MQPIIQGLKRSASVKTLVIGGLILVLLIPVSMIKGVVHDRDRVHHAARNDIMRSWGGAQLVAGPIMVIPYKKTHVSPNGNSHTEENKAYVLPASLRISTDVNPEVRYRGLHKVPVYSTRLVISGEFNRPDFKLLDLEGADIDWDNASIAIAVADARAIAQTPSIDIGTVTTKFGAGGASFIENMPPPIVANVGDVFANVDADTPVRFSVDLQIKGADSLRLAPLGDSTTVEMASDWASPSFIGNYLPETREVSDAGFRASWQISSLGRALPSQWTGRSSVRVATESSAFGVNFYMPVSLYQLTLRASKYAVLFIGLTFVAYFLFEIMASLRLHPLQYLLVGFANALFYLLLISLAEHIGFGWAYLASAAASTTLITGYSMSILGRRLRGLLMSIILTGLYSFLYMTLKAESYALLGGAIGLWVTLAIIMYLTRRIDWYSQGKAQTEG